MEIPGAPVALLEGDDHFGEEDDARAPLVDTGDEPATMLVEGAQEEVRLNTGQEGSVVDVDLGTDDCNSGREDALESTVPGDDAVCDNWRGPHSQLLRQQRRLSDLLLLFDVSVFALLAAVVMRRFCSIAFFARS